MRFTTTDVQTLHMMCTACKSSTLSPCAISDAIRTRAGSDGKLQKKDFHAAIRALVNGDDLTRAQQKFLTRMFGKLFKAFCPPRQSAAPWRSLAAGFSVLAAGAKSDKLSHAFTLFDTDSGVWRAALFWLLAVVTHA